MKLYTVWSGEYSDRTMMAIFQSEDKAKKYAEVQNELCSYQDCYIIDYELEDPKFNMNTQVKKYYFCRICLTDEYDYKDELMYKRGSIPTDEWWDDFMSEYGIENYEDLSIKNITEKLEQVGRNIDKEEDVMSAPTQNMIYTQDTIIEKNEYPNGSAEVVVNTTRGYDIARKIAIEQYQIYTQQQLEDGTYEEDRRTEEETNS